MSIYADIPPEQCAEYWPWVRRRPNLTTGHPILETLHEATCVQFPKHQRRDDS